MIGTNTLKQIRWLWGTLFLATAVSTQAADVAWSGTVRNASGDPLAAATVRLMNDRAAFTATTDSTGQFRFGNVKTGSYQLSIRPSGHAPSQPYLVQITAKESPAQIVLSD